MKTKTNKDLITTILTGDLDTLQLIEKEKITVQTPKKGLGETMIYDNEAVKKRFGLLPNQMTDYKGLVGDVSDNIPGIKGVGPKTTEKLLTEFNNLENLFAKMLPTHPLAQKILPRKDQAFFSKKLATINCDVPIDFTLADLTFAGLSLETLTPYFAKLGFNSLLSRLFKNAPERETTTLLQKVSDDKKGLFIISLASEANNKKILTNDTDLKIGFGWKQIIKGLLASNSKIPNPVFDLEIAGWLIDPDQKDFSFTALSQRFLYETASPTNKDVYLKLFAFLTHKLKEYELENIFYKLEMPLVPVLAHMENWGIATDIQKLKSLGSSIDSELKNLTEEIYKLAGKTFNINSPHQVGVILFEKLQIRTKRPGKTNGGQKSTAENILFELRTKHPIIDPILQYRENFKIKTGFVEPLIRASQDDNRIHTSFLQTGTATGRLSSEKPNVQNIPQESKWSSDLRKSFIADPETSFLSFDYSQLELRLLAHVSRDKKLTEAFLNNKDVHRLTAAQVFNTVIEKVTPEMRRLGKTLNFGVVYGMGSRGFAETSGITIEEAERFIDEYFNDFPNIKNWHEETKIEARTFGFVKNINGRRRWLPNINSQNPRLKAEMERRAINMPIQSLGADIIKSAMIKCFAYLKDNNLIDKKAKLLLSIHDELLFEVRDDILKKTALALKKIMENAYTLVVPLITEIKIGKNWGELKPFRDF